MKEEEEMEMVMVHNLFRTEGQRRGRDGRRRERKGEGGEDVDFFIYGLLLVIVFLLGLFFRFFAD